MTMNPDIRLPSPPAYTLRMGNQGGPDLSPELHELIKPLIIQAIQFNAGVPDRAVIAHVLTELPPTLEIPLADALNATLAVIESLVSKGEITKVSYKCEGASSTEYYPRDTAFMIEPVRNVLVDEAPSLPPLSSRQCEQVDSFISLLRGLDASVALHVLAAFCLRCGATAGGHVCNL